jgi:hypothetical protein
MQICDIGLYIIIDEMGKKTLKSILLRNIQSKKIYLTINER